MMSEIKPLHLGLVGPLPPPSGGMANQTRQLVRLLGNEGVKVEVIQVNPPYTPAWIGHIRVLRALFRLVAYVARLWSTARRVRLFHVMANSGWSWHLFAAPAVWVAKWHNVPVVINYRGGEAESFFQRSFRWVRPTLNKADIVVVPSAFLQRVFQKWAVPTVVVPNIIDMELFFPGGQQRGREASAQPHIVVARNLEKIYDIATAIRAFKRVRDRFPGARLTIAGSGPEEAALQGHVAELGLESAVVFTGRLENARMAELYRSADVVLNPSLADNMPISLLEALACAVPVVSTNVGGVPYIVEDGVSASLVAPGDDEGMARAVVGLLEDPVLARRLVEQGSRLAQQYTWPAVRARLFGVYQDISGVDSLHNHDCAKGGR